MAIADIRASQRRGTASHGDSKGQLAPLWQLFVRNWPLTTDSIAGDLTLISLFRRLVNRGNQVLFLSQSRRLSMVLLPALEWDLSHCTKNAVLFKADVSSQLSCVSLDIKFLLHAVRAVIGTKCLTVTYFYNVVHSVKAKSNAFLKQCDFTVLNSSLPPVVYRTTFFQSQFK